MKRRDLLPWCSGALILLLADPRVEGQPTVFDDPLGDAVIRRTDLGNDGNIDPQTQRLSDIIEMRAGRFSPALPAVDLFAGSWNAQGAFFRFDLVLAGLINPPGPLAFDENNPVYQPVLYGPNPIFGFVEFDADSDENTGGEIAAPEWRYLGAAARWGGAPSQSRFVGRAARTGNDLDHDFSTFPFVERSGEEFHLALFGEQISQVIVRTEKPGGNPSVFEAGETWEVRGDFFHRAHGWEGFILTCPAHLGRYQPLVSLLFVHDTGTNRTTVSLVYPLTNAAATTMIQPPPGVQPNNGCDSDQNSVEEALNDLRFSALNATPGDRLLPEFQLIAGWEFKLPSMFLDPAAWRVCANLGTAYVQQQGNGAIFAWTDIYPNVRCGDFNGDAAINALDATALNAFIGTADGNPNYDADGSVNSQLLCPDFASNFCLFDTNYDGHVSNADAVVIGDMNLDQQLTQLDVPDFCQALLDPALYSQSHGGMDPTIRGDANGDSVLDCRDIQPFVILLLGGP